MTILLTGATGYIGSAVLDALLADGHDVLALVRSDSAAERVAERGATPLIGDVTDVAWFARVLADTDGAIHAAAPDADAAAFNEAVVDAAVQAYAGTGKRFVLTSGVWEYGDGVLADDDALAPPALVAWRVPIEERLLASGIDGVIVAPGIVYGHGKGLLSLVTDAPVTTSGELVLLGDGEQHWSFVHVDDLAQLYVVALTHADAAGRVIASDGAPQRVRALAEAAAAASGASGVAAETADATRERLGAAFADALLLDQSADGAKARSLGWIPARASVLDEVVPATA
ncbi:NAD-dependent epimerase/dehydratase family protein [Agromyces sp. Leaf222]|uniref:NAD-dependent epimerase/dehydratase family protein n=1 Tax=Agromyces sp. Leaf222 TaxID=1735688 RepID=UPI0006F8DBE8|nr:NAD-dependent epimerase/dehydratase family protein [Agromyces sp. Leaf222]KQM80771.1 NAD-dependent dehydratase [Agromyces sp. Leaf222]